MIDTAVVNETLHRFGELVRIRTVQLKTPRRFVRPEAGKLESLLLAVDERPRIDHFAHVKPCPKSPANRSERIVRYTSHRRQNDGRPDTDRTNLYRREFSRLRHFHFTVDGAAVDRVHKVYVTNVIAPVIFRGNPIATKQTRGIRKMARLYIGNLPHLATESELQTWIESHGFKVTTVQVIKDLDT